MAALATRGVAAAQLDVALLERRKYSLTSAGLTFATADGDVFIPADGSVRGWLRRVVRRLTPFRSPRPPHHLCRPGRRVKVKLFPQSHGLKTMSQLTYTECGRNDRPPPRRAYKGRASRAGRA
jgi:hypothetical protein